MTSSGNPPLERRPEWRLTGIIFFGLIALIVLWATFRIVWPFVTPVLLGAILVTLTHSLYVRLRTRVHNRSWLAATIMLFGVTFLLVIPLFLIAIALVHEANGLIQDMQSGGAQQFLARLDLTNRLSFLRRWIPGFDPRTVSPQRLFLPILQEIPGWVARHGTAVVGGIAGLSWKSRARRKTLVTLGVFVAVFGIVGGLLFNHLWAGAEWWDGTKQDGNSRTSSTRRFAVTS